MVAEGLKVSIEKLNEEPYSLMLCYPKPSPKELNRRIKELRRLKVTGLGFIGEKRVFNVPVLGKGCVGLVVIAYRDGERAALKIRRVDADRSMMKHEAQMLKAANALDVGPRLINVSRNFLLMQFIEGDLLPKWLEKTRGKGRLRRVLRDVLEQCWRLDMAHLDHGELSHAPKHIIVDGRDIPFIVDFETASLNRKPANVTSLSQFLFINGPVAEKVAERLGGKDRNAIIKALKRYKSLRNRESFEKILEICEI
ncbi:MAG: RIO1 family regulatory kinase/ATPase [Candidatus Bathyarchaeia archaeon]